MVVVVVGTMEDTLHSHRGMNHMVMELLVLRILVRTMVAVTVAAMATINSNGR